jgi:hypothetical protein
MICQTKCKYPSRSFGMGHLQNNISNIRLNRRAKQKCKVPDSQEGGGSILKDPLPPVSPLVNMFLGGLNKGVNGLKKIPTKNS